jgi:F-type H+-transporting ATPase subunit gamma
VVRSRLLEVEELTDIHAIGYLIIAADRGLCGGYNTNVLRAAERSIRREQAMGRECKLYVVGKKAQNYFRFRGYPIERAFLGISDQPQYDDAAAVGRALEEAFFAGTIDVAEIAFTQFLSVGTQRVMVRRLMPVDIKTITEAAPEGAAVASYEFEPGPAAIFAELLPRYVESRIYAAMLDASASEHAARQRAMKAATDNAEELIRTLTRVMNRARQDAITTEIMEIVGGAEALRQSQRGQGRRPDLVSDDFFSDLIDSSARGARP